MNSQPSSLLTYDPGGIIRSGVATAQQLQSLAPRLESQPPQMERDAELWQDPPPEVARPLDAAFYRLPETLLAEHQQRGGASELGRIVAAADRLRGQADRVVVLGIGGSYMGARALMEACCRPYYNELDREGRNGRPRMYFEGNNVDNDAAQGLLELLRSDGQRWAVIVISKSGGTLETAAALRIFLRELESRFGSRAPGELVIPVTGAQGRLRDLAGEFGCQDVFDVPEGVGGRFSVLSAVGLLPAATLGLDVAALLQGAADMNEHFRSAPPGANAVLDYAGAGHYLETERNITVRVMCLWAKALEAAGLWYDQLLAESLGKERLGATPLTVLNTRDLHSRAQQHQEGRHDKLLTNVSLQTWQSGPLEIGHSRHNQDQLNDIADKTLPELMEAARQGTNEALESAGQPTADIRLPGTDEHSLGQLLQMLMLATVVEGRLLGVNPYGQPGVEAYKQNMARLLGR